MFFDLNVPVSLGQSSGQSKKGKAKQTQQLTPVAYTAAQISAIEARVDLLVHLGYTVLAFTQTVQKKLDPKSHVNVLDSLLAQLQKRTGVVFLKRLTIVLDEDSEKGFGLTPANAALLAPYDLLALAPTTAATFAHACLTHSQPSPLTAHIIAVPLARPRLPFHMKHTLVGTALKNGAVFEIAYAGVLGGEPDPATGAGAGAEGAKRNWWAAARELARVTKGKGLVVSGGAAGRADLRAPRDAGNLITLLGLAQNVAHDAVGRTPKALVLRAQTRRTYRAVLSEPRIVIPGEAGHDSDASLSDAPQVEGVAGNDEAGKKRGREEAGEGEHVEKEEVKRNKR